jgi:hypothetical protein
MTSAVAKGRRSDDFFRMSPRRSVVIFHVAVFCIFAPTGILFVSSLEPQMGWRAIAVNLTVSGLIAVCWAATFTVSRWFVIGIVATNLAMFAINTLFADTPIGIGEGRPTIVGLGVIAQIVLGYTLFVVFITGQGRTTMRLMTEMALARNIHETLVPAVAFVKAPIEALGTSTPSTEMGGDLLDVVDHGQTTDLFVADVSGHGVRAGVVMGMVKSAIRMGLTAPADLSSLLAELNDVLEATTSPELYATLAALRIDRSGRLEYALAGHHHLARWRVGAAALERLGQRTFPLGLFRGRSYETGSIDLARGDLLVVYTDGLNETADADDRELGHDPIERAVLALATRPLDEIRRAVFGVVERHGAQEDDRTLLLVRFGGAAVA